MLHGKCEGVNRKQTGWRHRVSRHYCLTNTKVFFSGNFPPNVLCFFEKQENLVNMDVVVFFYNTTQQMKFVRKSRRSDSEQANNRQRYIS